MKDNPDRPQEPLPVRRLPSPPVPPPAEYVDDYTDPQAAPPPKKFSLRLLFRALRRHWWQALVFWLAGSTGLIFLAYTRVKPTFDAVAQVRVELGDKSIFVQNNATPIDFPQFMQTQVFLITNPIIISTALANNPNLAELPLLRGSSDPEADIRQVLRVAVVPRTSLIQVEMSSPTPTEAAKVINAVVDAYLARAAETYDVSTRKRITQLEGTRDEKGAERVKQREIVEGLQKRLGSSSVESLKDRNVATVEAYRRWSEVLTHVEIMRIAAKAKLDQLRSERATPIRPQDDEQLRMAVTDEFYADPRVASLHNELEQAERKLNEAKRLTKQPSDPARVRQVQRVKELNDKKDELWRKLEPGLRRKLTSAPVDDTVERAIKQAETDLAATTTQEETLRSKLDQVRIDNNMAEGEALKLEFARRDLQRAEEIYDTINKNLSDLQYQAKNPVAQINLEFPAKSSNRPNSDRRIQVIAMAPVATGFLIMGLLVMLELRGGRVGDPEELTARMHLPVIGVVPPLPQIRLGSGGGNGSATPATQNDLRAQRELDEFVQSLDHLRVALCARRDPWGRDRHCVLITSACGSEGKTTLAAQLAERCVNAGLMTLLIDGDLRNPTLSRMLDLPAGRGLVDVLRGEAMAEEAIRVIGDAGGFHLLPAGTPRVDPSRLLQGDRLGKLIAQARESFDMIIIDAPPVLPVPDALTIGRWTDGVVLATRFDVSRFPLVERAHRRLAHVGVPVIGAVVNGVRSVESSYGGYYAYGGYGNVESASPASPQA